MLKRLSNIIAFVVVVTLAYALFPADMTTTQDGLTSIQSSLCSTSSENTDELVDDTASAVSEKTSDSTSATNDATTESDTECLDVDAAKCDDTSDDCSSADSIETTDTTKLAACSVSAAELVESYFDERAGELTGKSVACAGNVAMSDEVYAYSLKRTARLETMAASANLVVHDASTEVVVQSAHYDDDDTLSVDAYEQTTFTYDDLSDGVGGSDSAIFGTDHVLTIASDSDALQIIADVYDESDISGINTLDTDTDDVACDKSDVDASAASSAANTSFSSLSLSQIQKSSYNYQTNYNPAKTISYANRYALSYNSKYRNMNPIGGDCANFVSQCIDAGGLTQQSNWYYIGYNSFGAAWSYCPSMVSFFKKHGKYVINPSSSNVWPGSPVLYKPSSVWSHAAICVGYNSAGTPVINAHNNNRYHVPYSYWNVTRCTIQLTSFNYCALGMTFTTGDYTWITAGACKVNLYEYDGTAQNVSIASTVSYKDANFKIAGISSAAFKGNKKLVSIKMGTNIKHILSRAFAGAKHLVSVKLNSGCKKIGKYAFYNCNSLTKITGGSGVTSIGKYAFYKCNQLTGISSLAQLSSISQKAFFGCTSLAALRKLPKLKTIGGSAFHGCSSLKILHVMPRLKTIGAKAFYNCSALESVPKFKSLQNIGAYAFYSCAKLVDLPAFTCVKSIGAFAFAECCALEETPKFAALSSLGKKVFAGCTALTRAYLVSTKLKTLSEGTFYDCTSLLTVNIVSKKLSCIKKNAFRNCCALATLCIVSKKISTAIKVGNNTFTGVNATVQVVVPSAKLDIYRTWFSAKGLATTASFTAI